MSFQSVMRLPIRVFWSLNAQIARVRAEEQLHQIDMFLLANMNASGDMASTLRKHLSEIVGDPTKFTVDPIKEEAEDIAQHKEGIQRLRALQGQMRGNVSKPNVDPDANT